MDRTVSAASVTPAGDIVFVLKELFGREIGASFLLFDCSARPLVSVIIPAYNAAQFIGRTLASATAQSYPHLEIIVVNDGSTDATGAIVDEWRARDPRIRVITVPNGGVARARNLGIEASSAPLVAFLDADDLWHADKIKLQVDRFINSEDEIGGCYTFHREIDLDDNVIISGAKLSAEGYILARHIVAKLVGNGSSLMVRRDVARALSGFDPSYADRGIGGCEDLDFELKLAASYRIGVVPFYLVGYRCYEGNMSSNPMRMARGMTATIQAHLDANPSLPPLVRRYALAAAHDYCAWAGLRARRMSLVLASVARVAVNEPARSWRLTVALLARVLAKSRLALFGRSDTNPVLSHYLQLPADAPEPFEDPLTLRRFARLAEADHALLNHRQPAVSADSSLSQFQPLPTATAQPAGSQMELSD